MVVGLLMLIVALAACDSAPATPTVVPPTATVAAAPVVPDTVVFGTTGTIAGVQQALTIDKSLSATFTDRGNTKTGSVSKGDYNDLLNLLTASDFMNLNDRYDSGTVSDDRYFTITVTQGATVKTVMVAEVGGQGLTPQPLLDVIAKLQAIQAGVE